MSNSFHIEHLIINTVLIFPETVKLYFKIAVFVSGVITRLALRELRCHTTAA